MDRVLDAAMFRDEPTSQHAFQLRTSVGLSLNDCLQVHVFELPKYVVPSDNNVITDDELRTSSPRSCATA